MRATRVTGSGRRASRSRAWARWQARWRSSSERMSLSCLGDLDSQRAAVGANLFAGGRHGEKPLSRLRQGEGRGLRRPGAGLVSFRRRTAAQTASRTCWSRGGSGSAVVRSIGGCSSLKQSPNRSMSSRYETARPKDQGQPNSRCRHQRRSQPRGVPAPAGRRGWRLLLRKRKVLQYCNLMISHGSSMVVNSTTSAEFPEPAGF